MDYPYLIQNSYKNCIKEYLSENKNTILDLIYKTGAVLLRGFNNLETAIDFEEAIKIFQPNLTNYKGGDSPRDKVTSSIYTSTSYPPEETISMHQEKSFSNSYPKLIYFFCEVEPKFGGETPIADGRKIYNQLPKKIIKKLSQKKLKYIMNMHDGNGLGRSWQQVFETDSRKAVEELLNEQNIKYSWKDCKHLLKIEEVVDPIISHYITREKIFFSQAHQWHPSALDKEFYLSLKEIMEENDFYHNCLYGDNSKIEEEELEYIRKIINENRVFFKWKKGDLLILDNLISMHGRAPFVGERRILVGMS